MRVRVPPPARRSTPIYPILRDSDSSGQRVAFRRLDSPHHAPPALGGARAAGAGHRSVAALCWRVDPDLSDQRLQVLVIAQREASATKMSPARAARLPVDGEECEAARTVFEHADAGALAWLSAQPAGAMSLGLRGISSCAADGMDGAPFAHRGIPLRPAPSVRLRRHEHHAADRLAAQILGPAVVQHRDALEVVTPG
jgi:hypothetical protein